MSRLNLGRHGKDIRKAFIDTLPVMTGYLVLGMGFGVVMRARGYGLAWSAAEALFIYAGAMQYATVEMLGSGMSLAAAAATTLAVNARHLFYGISMLEKYRAVKRGRWYLIFALTDETYSLLCDDQSLSEVEDRTAYYFSVSLMDHFYWVTGCVAGSVLSSVLAFNASGADFALTVLFVSVFTGQWVSGPDHFPAAAGVLCSLLSLLVFGPDRFLIPAMILIVAVLLLSEGRNKDES